MVLRKSHQTAYGMTPIAGNSAYSDSPAARFVSYITSGTR